MRWACGTQVVLQAHSQSGYVIENQRAKRYRSRDEAEREHPRLKADNPVPLKDFVNLVGKYVFPKADFVRCQIVGPEGKCHQSHGKGWIAQLTDLSEGYIGHRCVEGHFGHDPRFAHLFSKAAERVEKEITIDGLVTALRSILQKPGVQEEVHKLKLRWRDLYQRGTDLPGRLTQALRKELASRRKRNSLDVVIRVIYVETEEDERSKEKRTVTTRRPVRYGVLSGLQALDATQLGKVGLKLDAVAGAMQQAIASQDQPQPLLEKWLGALAYIERAEQELSRYEATLAAFSRPDNLKLFWLLVPNRLDQLAAIRVAIDISSRRTVTDTEVSEVRKIWADEIRAANGERDFEVGG
jgi:hypothetical protein